MKNDKWGSGPVGVGEIEGNMKSHFFIVRGEVICVECVSLKQTVPPHCRFIQQPLEERGQSARRTSADRWG